MWDLQICCLVLEITVVKSAYRSMKYEEDVAEPSPFRRTGLTVHVQTVSSISSSRTLDRQRQIWYLQTP
jgi:hypothetical protein